MPRRKSLLLEFFVAACSLASTVIAQPSHTATVQSPGGNVRVVVRLSEGGGQVLYNVERGGRQVLKPSPIVVRLAGIGAVAGLTMERVEQRLIDESHDLPWGKTSRFRDHCREAAVRLKADGGILWDIELRAYDDGVALRYGFPKQQRLRDFVIEEEATEFRLEGDPTVLFMPLDHFNTSHEALYERRPLSEIPQEKLFATPLLAVWHDGSAAAITEARLRNFAGMYLERRSDAKSDILRSRLAPLPRQPHAVVAATTPLWSPWRVVLVADQAGKLIESNLLLCLNEPAEGDFSWVKPGKTTFHHNPVRGT